MFTFSFHKAHTLKLIPILAVSMFASHTSCEPQRTEKNTQYSTNKDQVKGPDNLTIIYPNERVALYGSVAIGTALAAAFALHGRRPELARILAGLSAASLISIESPLIGFFCALLTWAHT